MSMSIDFHWFLPTYGDSRYIVSEVQDLPAGHARGSRSATTSYLGQIAHAAEQLGFVGALTPTGAWCEDAWLTTAMLSPVTENLKFLVAFRPGLLSPTLAAQMAATFQRHSDGRLLINIVTGGDDSEQRSYGDFLGKDDRYRRTDEFLSIVRGLWSGEIVNFAGEFLSVEGAQLGRLPVPVPPIYFGGSSDIALTVAAKQADVYLTWGETPDQVSGKIAEVSARASEFGRSLRFGIRLHVISRDTSDEAWAVARQLLDVVTPEEIQRIQDRLSESDSVGQRRMRELHGGSKDNLEISPNLWAGIGLVRRGAGTALVGSHVEVADRIREYNALGISEFVLSGHPHLEEAYWFAEGVLPLLEASGQWWRPSSASTAASSPSIATARR
jgi:alkanesulfonate monooxygenase